MIVMSFWSLVFIKLCELGSDPFLSFSLRQIFDAVGLCDPGLRRSLPIAACLPASQCIMDSAVLFSLLALVTLSLCGGVGGAREGKAKLVLRRRDHKGSVAECSVCSVPQVARVLCSAYARRGPGTHLSLCIIKQGRWTVTSSVFGGYQPTFHLTRRYLP